MRHFVGTLRKKIFVFLFFAFIYLNRFSKFIFRLTYIDGVYCVCSGMVCCGVRFLVLRSLLLSSLVGKERHLIFDYNVNESKTQLLMLL